MRWLVRIMVLGLILSISNTGVAAEDFNFQVFLGVNSSTTDSSSFSYCTLGLSCTATASAGFLGGLYVDHYFGETGVFGVRSGLVAAQRVFTENYSGGSNGSFAVTIGYLDLPIYALLRAPSDKRFSFYGGIAYCSYTGSQITTANGYFSNQTVNTTSSNTIYKNPTALQAGLAFDLQEAFEFALGYETGLLVFQGNPNSTVSSFTFRVGYLF